MWLDLSTFNMVNCLKSQQVNKLHFQLAINNNTMKALTIAVANQKGGVAKTTSTICLGGLLSTQTNCLAIDLDPQGNLTTGLGIKLTDAQASCYDLITEQANIDELVISTFQGGLKLVPADITLAKGETEILTQVGNFFILKERLEPALTQYSHILIDCPPSLGLLTVNALAAADVVLIPVQCQFFALKGLASLLETIASVQKRLNPDYGGKNCNVSRCYSVP
jgi:chromosome partitioning protein